VAQEFIQLDQAYEKIKRLENEIRGLKEDKNSLISTNSRLNDELRHHKNYVNTLEDEVKMLNSKGIEWMNKSLDVSNKYEQSLKDYEELAKEHTHVINTLTQIINPEL
jgi:predicted  nucleic acid-binding Zn-ribbon protein